MGDEDFLAELHRELDATQVSPGQLALAITLWALLVLMWCVSQGVVP